MNVQMSDRASSATTTTTISTVTSSSSLESELEKLFIKDTPAKELHHGAYLREDMIQQQQQQRDCPAESRSQSGTLATRPVLHHSHTYFHSTRHQHDSASTQRPGPPRRSHSHYPSPDSMPSHTRNVYTDTQSTYTQQPQSPNKFGRALCQSSGSNGEEQGLDKSKFADVDQADMNAMDTAEDATTRPTPTSPTRWNTSGNAAVPMPLSIHGRPMSTPNPYDAASTPTPAHPDSQRNSTASLPVPMAERYTSLPEIGKEQQQQHANEGDPTNVDRDELSTSPPSSPSSSRPRPQYMARENTYPPYYVSTSGFLASPSVIASTSPKPGDWLRDFAVPYASYGSPPSSSSGSFTSTSSSSSIASAESSYIPPPAPPTVLTPPPFEEERRARAPHEPFLSHAAPPGGTDIRVETSVREYRLLVRLPGFRRDAITLSTRRRRILHIVADSWEPGGGHLERRISFGYDADLTQVRAEFDGEVLRVTVPRRVTPMTYMEARLS